VVAAHEDGHSYLDRYQPSRDVFYGVLENKLSDKTTLTLGYSYQKEDGKGAMWGALPMSYTDGSSTNYPVAPAPRPTGPIWIPPISACLPSWPMRWTTAGSGRARWVTTRFDTDSALFYVYGTPNKSTGGGLYAYPSLYDSSNKQVYFDSNLGGKYTLAERQHDFNIG
jgi:outer membrane receptor for ferric coprogen and ferric-rhodotorulic acid